jgi:tRNA-splicing ligase RtcB
LRKTPRLKNTNNYKHLGTLGSGNHFIEIASMRQGRVVHAALRLARCGNAIGTHFIELAKKDMQTHFINLPDQDLAYLSEGTQHYDDYIEAVGWAQKFARTNREVMMHNLIAAVRSVSASRSRRTWRRSTATTTMCSRASLRQGCAGHPQRCSVGA